MSKKSNNYIKAFTMLELGVAMMCMAILATLFLFGKDIINAAKLNKEISELASFKSSFNGFTEKYNCLPGDCKRATDFIDGTACSSQIGGATCNGDGNSKYDTWTWANDAQRYWIHQEMTGFLPKGSYLDPGELKFRGSTYSKVAAHFVAYGRMNLTGLGSADFGIVPDMNVLLFSGVFFGTPAYGSVLSPISAESLDRKMDDGSPNTGAIMAYQANNPPQLVAVGDCLTGSGTLYNIANEGLSCFLTMRLGD